MSKLFEIEITVRAVVLAESVEDAYAVACDCKREIIGDSTLDDIDVGNELAKGCQLPTGWDEKCYPYGFSHGQHELRIGQIWEQSC